MGNTFVILWMALNVALSLPNKSINNQLTTLNQTQFDVNRQLTEVDSLYDEMNLAPIIKYEAFRQAMEGRKEIHAKNSDIVSIIDFTLPSTEKDLLSWILPRKRFFFIHWSHTVKIAETTMRRIFPTNRNRLRAHWVFCD